MPPLSDADIGYSGDAASMANTMSADESSDVSIGIGIPSHELLEPSTGMMRTHVLTGAIRIGTSNEARPAVVEASSLDVVTGIETPCGYPSSGTAMKMQTAVHLPNATMHLGQDDISLFQSLSRDFNAPVAKQWMSSAHQGMQVKGPWAPRY